MSATIGAHWEPTHNHLLAWLTAEDRVDVLRDAQLVQLELGQVLVVQGDAVPQAYFPLSGLCALLVIMRSGRIALASLVGNDGLVGVASLLGGNRSTVEAICQVPGAAVRIPTEALRRLLADRPPIREAFLRYAALLLAQSQQNAACNRLHEIEPRLARWLLVVTERLRAPDLPLTQELMGAMLAVRRASVSKAAEALQRRNLIRYHRGRVLIVDAPGLEAAACECYRVIRTIRDELLG